MNEVLLSHNIFNDDATIDKALVVSVPIASSSANTNEYSSEEYKISLSSFISTIKLECPENILSVFKILV